MWHVEVIFLFYQVVLRLAQYHSILPVVTKKAFSFSLLRDALRIGSVFINLKLFDASLVGISYCSLNTDSHSLEVHIDCVSAVKHRYVFFFSF